MNVPQSKVLFLGWCSFAQVKSVLAVASGKGGVGKSSVPELSEDFKERRQ